MKKILFLIGSLFLFTTNTATAIAPTQPHIIVDFVPVELPERPTPKILTPEPIVLYTETVEGAKAYALDRLGRVQFNCLDKLFTKESNWRVRAQNSSSGAYGIPQALPGSKMASIAADWRTNPITQVKWGIKYVNGRYGSACGAWNFSARNGWY